MAKYHHLFSLVYSFLVGGSWFCASFVVAAVGTDDGEKMTTVTLTCLTGWSESPERAIPKDWINDGYCDCPFDGKDEPNTNACSGSFSWPGVDKATSESPITETHFVCPKQPKLVLPVSRLHDGICDCCDGSDEDPTGIAHAKINPCPDDCDTILKAEREGQAKIQNDFRIGSRKRETDLLRFSKLRTKKAAEAVEYEKLLAVVESEIDHIKGTQIVGLKEAYVSSRVATMKDSVAGGPMAISLLSGLEDEELESILVHLCQVAGEITKSDGRHGDDINNTCLALRVAALDLGLTWSDPEDYEGGTTEATFHDITAEEVVDIVFENASEPKNKNSKALPPLHWKSWSSKENRKSPAKGRRRLDEINDDYSMHDDEYDYGYHMDDDEDFNEEDRQHRDSTTKQARESHQKKSSSKEHSEAKGKEKELIDEIRTSLFSANRATFLKESQKILDEINKILDVTSPKKDSDDETVDKKETDVGETSESDKSQVDDESEATEGNSANATIDQTAYTMLRNNLREKRDVVERGFRWGASAKILLGASSKESTLSKREILDRLVVGTIFYGQISALHAWQIIQAVLPEYKVLSQNNEAAETTCASPWAGNCPPNHVYREFSEGGYDSAVPGIIEYPPSFLLQVAAAFCDEEASNFGKEGAITNLACQEKNDSNNNDNVRDVIESLSSLPSSEGNRLFGYVVPTRRNEETDPFQTMFDPILNLPIDIQSLQALEGERTAKEKDQKGLTKNIETVWKDIGGRNGKSLGRDGELHLIANECFEVVAGKYTYELCLSGKAQQKEGSAKSGTNLGNWKGIEYLDDENDGSSTRVLKWEDGAKCWNGPKRSATAYLKCGPNHKVMSADEPDTCRYVFQMETYLACDDVYKRRVGL